MSPLEPSDITNDSRIDADTAFVVRLATALHRFGVPCHNLEALIHRLTQALLLPSQVMSLPTAFLASFGPWEHQRSVIVRVDAQGLDLTKVAKLIGVAHDVAEGRATVTDGTAQVVAIEQAPVTFGSNWQLVAGTLASAAVGRLFGGSVADMLVSALIGLVVAVQARLLAQSRAARVYEPLAAVTASAIAAAAAYAFIPISPVIVVLSGLIMMLPGYTITVAFDELAARHLVAGTTRLVSAITMVVFLGLGVVLVNKMVSLLGIPVTAELATALPPWLDAVAVGVALLAFAISLSTPPRELPWVLLLGGTAELVERLIVADLGRPLAVSLAACLVAASTNLYARLTGRLASVVLAPAITMLLPGSLSLRSMLSFADSNVVSGVDSTYQMVLIAGALVTGLLVGNLLVPVSDRAGRVLSPE